MTDELTDEKIAKLPQWAQKHLRDLETENHLLHRTMREMEADQPESPFYRDDLAPDPKTGGMNRVRHYTPGHDLYAAHAGVVLHIVLREDRISLAWSAQDPDGLDEDVAMVGAGRNAIDLRRVRFIKGDDE